MAIVILCPSCERKLRIPEEALGKKVKCPGCSSTFVAEAKSAASPAEEEPVEEIREVEPPADKRHALRERPGAAVPILQPIRDWGDEDDDEDESRSRRPTAESRPKKKSRVGLLVGLLIGGLLLLLLAGGGAIAGIIYWRLNKSIDASAWKDFSPPDSRCHVLMPGTPQNTPIAENFMAVPAAQAVQPRKYVLDLLQSERIGFLLIHMNIPDGADSQRVFQTAYAGERDRAAITYNGKLVSDIDIRLGEFAGKEFQVRASDGGMAIMRMYLVQGSPSRVYMISAYGARARPDSPDVVKFFNSFRIDPSPPAENPNPNPIPNPIPNPNPNPNPEPNPPPQPKSPIFSGPTPDGELITLQASQVQNRAVALAHNGKLLATGAEDNVLHLWTIDGKEVGAFQEKGWINDIAFSPDGSVLANGNNDGTLSLREGDTGKPIAVLLKGTPADCVTRIAFSPDGKLLAAAAKTNLRVWNVAARAPAEPIKMPAEVLAVAFAPDNKTVALGFADNTVRVLDLGEQKEKVVFRGHDQPVLAVAVAPNGKMIASASADQSVRLWDAEKEDEIDILDGHTARATSVAFTSDGKTLASGSEDGTVRLWDVETRKAKAALKAHPYNNAVLGISLLRDGSLVASASHGLVRVWDLPMALASAPVPPAVPFKRGIRLGPKIEEFITAAAAPERKTVFVLPNSAFLKTYSYPQFKLTGSYRIGGVAYKSALDAKAGLLYLDVSDPKAIQNPHANHNTLGTGDIHVYDVRPILEGKAESGKKLEPVAVIKLDGTVASLLLSPDGKWLYYLNVKDPKNIQAGRIDTATREKSPEIALAEKTEKMVLSRDGKMLYSASRMGKENEGRIYAIDPAAWKITKDFTAELDPGDFDATDSGLLFVVNASGGWTNLHVVDVQRGLVLVRWRIVVDGHRIQFSPDQKRYYLSKPGGSPQDVVARAFPEKLEANAQQVDLGIYTAPGPVGRDFYITPDGRFLMTRIGQVLKLTPTP
jgi:WD40 repeat protein